MNVTIIPPQNSELSVWTAISNSCKYKLREFSLLFWTRYVIHFTSSHEIKENIKHTSRQPY